MGESLRDQLLKAGLKEQLHQRKRKKRRPGSAGKRKGEPSLAKAWAARERTERQEQTRHKQAKLEDQARRKRQNDAVKAVVEKRTLNDPEADIARHFRDGGRITRLYVTAEQQRGLAEGRLGIVKLRGRYLLADADTIEQVRGIKPDAVIDLSSEVRAVEPSGADE